MKRLLPIAFLLAACSAAGGEPAESVSLGETLYRLIVGGIQIGEATLLRFYVWHIVGLIVPMIFLIGWHAFKVRRDGGISHQERAAGETSAPRIDRELLVRTETLAFFITLAALIVISTFFDAPVGSPPDQGSAANAINAPWIFLWVQELLRLWPPAIAGVLVPVVVTALLAALPFIDRRDEGVAEWFNRPGRLAQIIMIVILVVVGGLTIRGALR